MPTSGNIVTETKFASQEAKIFPKTSEAFLQAKQCFLVCPNVFEQAWHVKAMF